MDAFDSDAWLHEVSEHVQKRKFNKVKEMRSFIAAGTGAHSATHFPNCVSPKASTVYNLLADTLPQLPGVLTTGVATPVVRNMDCLDLEKDLRARGFNPCVLNMASPSSPGGGWMNGAGAQEESLFYRSDYNFHIPHEAYPFASLVTCIYTPNVHVFREGESKGFAFLPPSEVREVAFVAAAALKKPMLTADGMLTPGDLEMTKIKIRRVLRVALNHGHDSIVLGAWGCGAFANPPRSVARAFRDVFYEDAFLLRFRAIEFAIFDDHNAKKEGNYTPFAEIFQPAVTV